MSAVLVVSQAFACAGVSSTCSNFCISFSFRFSRITSAGNLVADLIVRQQVDLGVGVKHIASLEYDLRAALAGDQRHGGKQRLSGLASRLYHDLVLLRVFEITTYLDLDGPHGWFWLPPMVTCGGYLESFMMTR